MESRERARRLRAEMSVSEIYLWEALRKKKFGFLFKRQVPVGPYILDFYCPEAKLCVEVDGEQHLLTLERDGRRDQYLAEQGIETLRIKSLDLFDESSAVVTSVKTRIVSACELQTGRTAFPD